MRFMVATIGLMSAAITAFGVVADLPASAEGVKIGILNDQSGVYADFGGKGSVEAAKMAIEDFGGGVLGQKIELVSADHQNKPDLAASIARRWYDAEGVDMITDLTTSSVALAVQGSGEKKKIDIVVGAATSALTGKACTPYGFHWAYDTHALAVSTGGALVRTGGRHLVLRHRGLCFRSRPGERQEQRHRRERGQGAGACALSPQRA